MSPASSPARLPTVAADLDPGLSRRLTAGFFRDKAAEQSRVLQRNCRLQLSQCTCVALCISLPNSDRLLSLSSTAQSHLHLTQHTQARRDWLHPLHPTLLLLTITTYLRFANLHISTGSLQHCRLFLALVALLILCAFASRFIASQHRSIAASQHLSSNTTSSTRAQVAF